MPDTEATKHALSLMEQIPLLGIFVLAVVVLLWINRYWQSRETSDWRACITNERQAFEAALDRVIVAHKEANKGLADEMKHAFELLRQTIQELRMAR